MSTKTLHRSNPEFSVRARQLGGFGIIDKFGKCRVTVPTRDAADDWIATQAKLRRQAAQSAMEVQS
jgi:hypothetical protein